jgi:hypothetical protein
MVILRMCFIDSKYQILQGGMITHYVLTGSPAQVQKSTSKPPPSPPDKGTPVPVAPVRTQTSPASLYATPESTTLPDSPSSFPGTWSPYIINHKRRGASLAKTSRGDVGSGGSQPKLQVMLSALPKGGEPVNPLQRRSLSLLFSNQRMVKLKVTVVWKRLPSMEKMKCY